MDARTSLEQSVLGNAGESDSRLLPRLARRGECVHDQLACKFTGAHVAPVISIQVRNSRLNALSELIRVVALIMRSPRAMVHGNSTR